MSVGGGCCCHWCRYWRHHLPHHVEPVVVWVSFGWAVRVVDSIMLALLIYAGVTTKEFAPRRQKNLFLPQASSR